MCFPAERFDPMPESAIKLYAGSIAVVAGGYTVLSATRVGADLSTAAWAMILLGAVVLAHGVAMFTQLADRRETAHGPSMVVYAVLLVLSQGWISMGGAGSAGDGSDGGAAFLGWDPGVVALAVLLLVSGIIMIEEAGALAEY